MVVRSVAFVLGFAVAIAARGITQEPNTPEMPNPQMMQMQVQRIMQERPREAEAAARAFLMLVAPNLVGTLDSLKAGSISGQNQPLIVIDGVLRPGLSSRSLDDEYWAEVGQLTVQFGMVQNLNRRDSVRAQLVGKMFGLEANARAQQRAYRSASESNRVAVRKQIEALITTHFDIEDQLRALEVADIERRLADVRAESQRRREKRSEFIKFAVEDIVRDALRPQ